MLCILRELYVVFVVCVGMPKVKLNIFILYNGNYMLYAIYYMVYICVVSQWSLVVHVVSFRVI